MKDDYTNCLTGTGWCTKVSANPCHRYHLFAFFLAVSGSRFIAWEYEKGSMFYTLI